MRKNPLKKGAKSLPRGRGATSRPTTQVFHNKWLLILVSFLVLFTLGLGVVLCVIGVSKSPFMAVSGPTNVDYWTDSADYCNTNWLGEGTIDAPYEIHTAADLAGLSYAIYSGTAEVKNGDYYYQNTYFKQMADIDLSAHYWCPIGAPYIGVSTYPKFAGHYDGGNFTISGVFTIDTSKTAGLFGSVSGEENNIATIKNVKIVDSYIVGSYSVGAIIGDVRYAEISNCYNYADVKATSTSLGGIIGAVDYNTTITNCQNFGFIDGGDNHCGGIVGHIGGMDCRVHNCVNYGEIKGSSQYTGGIVGSASCDITQCSNTNSVSGSGYVGGIVGQVFTNFSPSIASCYNTGSVTSTSSYAGGISGYYGNVLDCYNTGAVSGTNYVGGINGGNGEIKNTYNTGAVSGDDYVGGIIGQTHNSSEDINCNNFNLGLVTATGSNVGGITGATASNLAPVINSYYGGDCGDIGGVAGSDTDTVYYISTIAEDAKTLQWFNDASLWYGAFAWDFNISWKFEDGESVYPVLTENYAVIITAMSYTAEFNVPQGWGDVTYVEMQDGHSAIIYKYWLSAGRILAGETLEGKLPTSKDEEIKINWMTSSNNDQEVSITTPIYSNLTIYARHEIETTWQDFRSQELDMQGVSFLISSAEDLAFVSYEVAQGNPIYTTASYIQTQDIDLSAHYWSPIGTEEHPFAGNYNGNGFKIKGLKNFRNSPLMEFGGSMTKYYDFGLFRYVVGESSSQRSKLSNIGIVDSNIVGLGVSGAIAAYVENCDISGCYNEADLCSTVATGGIVGEAKNSSFVRCYNTGDINGGGYVVISIPEEPYYSYYQDYDQISQFSGGIAASIYGVTITDCYNLGNISASMSVGGIVSSDTLIDEKANDWIDDISSTNLIERSYNEGKINTIAYNGGIIGNMQSSNTTVNMCYNTGEIGSKVLIDASIGAILMASGGICSAQAGTITNCYNTGVVNGSLGAGGISGVVNSGKIANTFNTGEVYYKKSPFGKDNIQGGIAGGATSGTIINSYYGGNCSNIGGVSASDTTGASYSSSISDDAKNEDWYKDGSLWNPDYPWNIGEDWFIVDGYPTFEPPTTWLDDPSYYDHVFEGTGEKDKPYLIQTNKELAGLSYLIQNYNETYVGKYFKLTADVDMSEYYWVPIGTSAALAFRGYFDGGNHVISGLKTFLGWDGTGLFGTALSTTDDTVLIQNVIISESKISGSNNTGGVVGIGQNISLQNCQVAGETSVKGGYVGGIAGYVMQSTVQNCFVNGSLQLSGDYLGGVVGYAQSSQIVNLYLPSNAIVTGTASGVFSKTDSGFVGGIVGGAQESEILQAYNYGTVNATWGVSIENLSGTPLSLPVVGGIIGFAKQQTLVYGCNNLGTVTCDIFAAIGGIAGQVDNSTISTCFNYGTLKGSDTQQIEGAIKVIGGIVATPINNAKIYDCTNYATIIEFMGYTGGIAGMSMPAIVMLTGGSEMEEFLLSAQQISIENCYNYGNIESLIAGGIIAMAIKCNISDCINAGVVGFYDEKYTASDTVGGIAAMVGGDCTLDGLYNIGDVIGENCAAGIVGMVQSLTGEVQTLNLNHCFNSGTIYTYESFAAGLVGNASSFNLIITNSESIGDIHIILIDGGFYGRVNVSGIVGSIGGSGSDSAGSLTVSNCAVKMEVYFECRGTTSIEENGAYVAGICFEIEVNSIDIDNCAINITGIHYSDEKSSGIVVSDANVNPFFIYSPQDTLQVVNNCYALITNNTTNSQNNIVLDNGGMDGNFVYKDGMFDGMAVPVNLYHIDDCITSTGILTYLQQTFNVQPYVAA